MRYKLLYTDHTISDTLIRFKDLQSNQEYVYYLSEIPNVKLPHFKKFILPLLKDIESREYDIKKTTF